MPSVFIIEEFRGIGPRVDGDGVQDKKVILDTNRATLGIQGGAERVRPRGW